MERSPLRDEPVYSVLALRHGIARARATLEWADEAGRLLDDPERNRLSAKRGSAR